MYPMKKRQEGGYALENPILARLCGRMNVNKPDPIWLLTLLTVLDIRAYSLDDWNEALSHVVGRRICCPSYRTLSAYLQELALGVK